MRKGGGGSYNSLAHLDSTKQTCRHVKRSPHITLTLTVTGDQLISMTTIGDYNQRV